MKILYKQIKQLKELMNKLDPNEEDSSGDELNKTTTQPQSSQQNNQDSSSDTDNGESKQKTSLDVCLSTKIYCLSISSFVVLFDFIVVFIIIIYIFYK